MGPRFCVGRRTLKLTRTLKMDADPHRVDALRSLKGCGKSGMDRAFPAKRQRGQGQLSKAVVVDLKLCASRVRLRDPMVSIGRKRVRSNQPGHRQRAHTREVAKEPGGAHGHLKRHRVPGDADRLEE